MELVRKKRTGSLVNFTPMIDMVFQLIIFFMLTTTFTRNELLDLSFADSEKASSGGISKTLMVSVRNDRRLEINGTAYEHQEFEVTLRRILLDHPDKVVLLRAEQGVTTQGLVSAMDLAHMAGARNITLAE